MAGQADGYIIIDTEIDTNGAKAGSMYNAIGVAYKAIQELSKEVSELKEKLKRYEEEE